MAGRLGDLSFGQDSSSAATFRGASGGFFRSEKLTLTLGVGCPTLPDMEAVRVRHAVYASREHSARAAIAAALQALVEVSFLDSGATEAATPAVPAPNLLICDTTMPLPIPAAAYATLPRIAVTHLAGRAARDQMFAALLDGVDHVCSLANADDLRAAVATVLAPNVMDFGLARGPEDAGLTSGAGPATAQI